MYEYQTIYNSNDNDSSNIRISIPRRRQRSFHSINIIHRMTALTMVFILPNFLANIRCYSRQIYSKTTLFATGFSVAPTSTLPSYIRNLQTQQRDVPKISHSVGRGRMWRQYISFALSDSAGRGRIEEPAIVLEDIDGGMAVPSVLNPTPSSPATAIATATKTLITPVLNDVPETYADSASSPSSTTVILTDEADFIRPDRDLRSYRFIQLSNNLRCLLVCDNMQSGVGVEAASVHVQAGHFDDTIPGLARTFTESTTYPFIPSKGHSLTNTFLFLLLYFAADFHEHMLFLGTEKYSDEDEYETYLNQYGGFSNAYTDMEDTNYFFSITTDAEESFTSDQVKCTDALHGAMDRLAQFFIAPKFDRNMVERELQAIDSEYRNGLTNDSWRNFQLLKLSANQTHPISKFGCGNYETLMSAGQDKLLEELQQFWQNYYATYNLRLAVVGHGSLDALQSMVEDTFGPLPHSTGIQRHHQVKVDQFFVRENAAYDGIAAFGRKQLGVIRHIIPIAETRTIKIMFSTPPLDDPAIRSSKPYRAISHFLGHESPGSLHALLNDDGFITSLSSGLALDTSDFSLFSLTLGLTPKGMKQKFAVLDLVFQWVALLRRQTNFELRSLYHNELRQISDMSFRFRENDDPADFCSMAAEQLFEEGLDPARVLVASNEAGEHDASVETEFLNRLRPINCIIDIVDSDLKTTAEDGREWKNEKWYGGTYTLEQITADNMNRWTDPPTIDDRLYAPELNAYIPTDFSLRCDDPDLMKMNEIVFSPSMSLHEQDSKGLKEESTLSPPTILLDRPNLRLWHKIDQYWRVPKAFVKIAILSPNTYRSPRAMTLNRIFQRVLNDDLNSFVYDASQAGINYKVSCTPSGYRISVKGYSEKLPFLFDTLTTRMITLIDEMKTGRANLQNKFDNAVEALLRETKNYRLDAPSEVANYNSRLLIEQNVWCLDSYVAEMEGELALRNPLTMEECASEAQLSLIGRLKCEAICMGNVNENEAQNIANVLDRHFLAKSQVLSDIEIPVFRSMKLPTKKEAVALFGSEVSDRSVPLIYQELACTVTEENNAIELILQAGCEMDLGYEGIAVLDLIAHMAFNSAFAMLRTKEQLGYIVSAHARKTAGGAWGMSVVVQSSVALPEVLEERCEAWLVAFRQELGDMTSEEIAQEASAVVAQLLEKDTKMSQEVGRAWSEILNTEGLTGNFSTPEFDRVQYLADELIVADEDDYTLQKHTGLQRKSAEELKQTILDFFDQHFSASSPSRRCMSSRVYRHGSQDIYDTSLTKPGILSTYADMRYIKQFLCTWPNVPYWFKQRKQ